MPENEKPFGPLSLHEERLAEIWAGLEARGITEQDIADAVDWARSGKGSTTANNESVVPDEPELSGG